MARKCLRRHIITPYKHLPNDELFSVVTYGCRLKLNRVFGYEDEIASYLRVSASINSSAETGKFLILSLSLVPFSVTPSRTAPSFTFSRTATTRLLSRTKPSW